MIKFIKVRDVKSPEKGHIRDSGIDFFIPNDLNVLKRCITFTPNSMLPEEQDELQNNFVTKDIITIPPGIGANIPSGIKMILPGGHDLVFENKSGIATKYHLIIGAKVIDNNYRGEVHLHLINVGRTAVTLKPGQKVAQAILRRVGIEPLEKIDKQDFDKNKTERDAGGFGSTGE